MEGFSVQVQGQMASLESPGEEETAREPKACRDLLAFSFHDKHDNNTGVLVGAESSSLSLRISYIVEVWHSF